MIKKFLKRINSILNFLIHFLFPNFCQNCGKMLKTTDKHCFCTTCWNKIQLIDKYFCKKCGKLVITSSNICYECKKRKIYYNNIRAVGVYKEILKTSIQLYKYHYRWKIGYDFLDLIQKTIPDGYIKNNDIIIPVPVTYKEIKEKGFHHTYFIVKLLSKKYSIPSIKNLVIKTRHTMQQSKLSKKERLQNLTNAFALNKKYKDFIKNKKVLLFDDVYTTGSTVQEISKVIKTCGAKEINILTIGR